MSTEGARRLVGILFRGREGHWREAPALAVWVRTSWFSHGLPRATCYPRNAVVSVDAAGGAGGCGKVCSAVLGQNTRLPRICERDEAHGGERDEWEEEGMVRYHQEERIEQGRAAGGLRTSSKNRATAARMLRCYVPAGSDGCSVGWEMDRKQYWVS